MNQYRKALIVDIDGTISDASNRKHYVENKPKNFKAFYSELINDNPNTWCVDLVRKLSDDDGYEIIYVTGRPDNYRTLTEEWFRRWGIYFDEDLLFMRKEGDFREDYVVKEEIYNNFIKDKFDILVAIDDRKQVVDMWRRNGIICLQCDEGNF